jgi:hypothetical protein
LLEVSELAFICPFRSMWNQLEACLLSLWQ